MQLVLISGLSGSGKSIALNALEDSGYYCVDNLPGQLLQQSAELLRSAGHRHVAMSIDARMGDSLDLVPEYVAALKAQGVDLRLLFLDAKNDTLMRRFSETRRRHPLATGTRTLEEALTRERELLAPVGEIGYRLDTTDLLPNTLRNWIKEWLDIRTETTMLLFESFSYKQGVPLDADLVFDVRCLPNPHYDPRLRPLTGQGSQARIVMRIGQTAHVEHQIRIQGNALLVAERFEQKHGRFGADVEPFLDPVAQRIRQQIGRVEAIADLAHGCEDLALARQGRRERARARCERMAPARLGEAPDQGIVLRVEEEQAQVHALSFQRGYVFRDELERVAHAGVDAHCDMLVACTAEQLRRLLEQLPREIVDAVVAAVLQCVEGDALAGTREAADEDELHFDTLAECREPRKSRYSRSWTVVAR